MKIPAIVLALIMAGACCYAQESRGTILGLVTDSSDAVIVGATVRAVSLATNTGGASVTNAQGNYEIPYLQPGPYRVTVDMVGFRKAVRDNVEVNVDDRLVLDFKLQVGDVSQSVVVTADTPLVEASSPSVGTVINEQMITELPVAGGNAFYLARLATGVAATGGHSPGNPFDLGHASSTIIVNGTRTGSCEVSLDGASNMSGNQASFSPPQDLVQEFKIQTLAFDASLGHGTGAIVNVSIKSGTNALHGSTYFFDSGIRANPWFYNHYLYDPATGPVTPEKKRLAGSCISGLSAFASVASPAGLRLQPPVSSVSSESPAWFLDTERMLLVTFNAERKKGFYRSDLGHRGEKEANLLPAPSHNGISEASRGTTPGSFFSLVGLNQSQGAVRGVRDHGLSRKTTNNEAIFLPSGDSDRRPAPVCRSQGGAW